MMRGLSNCVVSPMVQVSALAVASILIVGSAQAQERNAYFGETHVHTSWSFDAYIFGNT